MTKRAQRKKASAATKAGQVKPYGAGLIENTLPPQLPKEAIAANGLPYMRARLKNPNNPKQYYRGSGTAGRVWVEHGYDTYDLEDWKARFGTKDGSDPDPARHWEFFGDPIDIWGSYSDE